MPALSPCGTEVNYFFPHRAFRAFSVAFVRSAGVSFDHRLLAKARMNSETVWGFGLLMGLILGDECGIARRGDGGRVWGMSFRKNQARNGLRKVRKERRRLKPLYRAANQFIADAMRTWNGYALYTMGPGGMYRLAKASPDPKAAWRTPTMPGDY
jgi:hypothetical protein